MQLELLNFNFFLSDNFSFMHVQPQHVSHQLNLHLSEKKMVTDNFECGA